MSNPRIATIEAARGKPLHLAHLQFYSYGSRGQARLLFGGGAARRGSQFANPNVTVDVGQVMFRQTVTISLDVVRQYSAIDTASPKKSVIFDGDTNGAGIVPFNYRSNNFYNAVQWAAGLELFLLINDPMRVFFTTDHPNGAPYTTYPDLFALIMSREERAKKLAELPEAAVELTTLPSITREYTFNEIATMTRVAPAKILGLPDRGHLGPGALADVAVYNDDRDRAAMFRFAHLVFKDGDLVVRDGARHALSLRPGAEGEAKLRPDNGSKAEDAITTISTVFRPISSKCRRRRSGAKIHSGRSHAADDKKRSADRREFRRSFSDARHGADHHGAEQALGPASGHHHDGLRDLRHRLRRRGGHRLRRRCARDAGRASRRARAHLRHVERRTAEAAHQSRRPMRAHLAGFGLFLRSQGEPTR